MLYNGLFIYARLFTLPKLNGYLMSILFLNYFKNENRPHFFWGLHENISGHKKRRLESLLQSVKKV